MAKYRKKPVVVDAFEWTGGYHRSKAPEWLVAAVERGRVWFDGPASMKIRTLEGIMTAHPGDWIIRGIIGELYPCKPGIFAATYEAVS